MRKTAEERRDEIVEKARNAGVFIPEWIPTNLLAEFCDCALEYGSTMAEDYIRSRKRENELNEFGRLIGRS